MQSTEILHRFQVVIDQHQRFTGHCLPWLLSNYIAHMLADHLRDTDIVTDQAMILRIEQARRAPGYHSLQDLGDRCLLTVAIMPDFGQRRGITRQYWIDLGRHAYQERQIRQQSLAIDLLLQHLDHTAQWLQDLLHSAAQINPGSKMISDKYFYEDTRNH